MGGHRHLDQRGQNAAVLDLGREACRLPGEEAVPIERQPTAQAGPRRPGPALRDARHAEDKEREDSQVALAVQQRHEEEQADEAQARGKDEEAGDARRRGVHGISGRARARGPPP